MPMGITIEFTFNRSTGNVDYVTYQRPIQQASLTLVDDTCWQLTKPTPLLEKVIRKILLACGSNAHRLTASPLPLVS